MVHCAHTGMDMVSNNAQVDLGLYYYVQLVLRGPKSQEKSPPHNYSSSSSLKCWYKAGWIHAFRLFTLNSEPTPECGSKHGDSSDQAAFFLFFLFSSIVDCQWWQTSKTGSQLRYWSQSVKVKGTKIVVLLSFWQVFDWKTQQKPSNKKAFLSINEVDLNSKWSSHCSLKGRGGFAELSHWFTFYPI